VLPEGRFIKFLDNDLVLEDELINPYGQFLPVVCFRPSTTFGSAYGYSPLHDMLPVQEAINLLDSTILSNQKAFGVQNIAVPRASGIMKKNLSEGLNLIEYDANPDVPNAGLPTPLMLLATPAEIFNYRGQLKVEIEQLANVSPINRGQVASGLSSGTSLAILSSQSLAANSILEAEYNLAIEHIALRILYTMGRYAKAEELLAISGKTNATAVSSFQGEDLQNIKFVRVIRTNPLSKNYAGRSDIADKLLNAGLLKHPSQYFSILSTGQIDGIYEQEGQAEQSYLQWENEQLATENSVPVINIDNHSLHILSHRVLLFEPLVRQNIKTIQTILDHIIEHQTNMEQMAVQNPMLLQLIDSGKAIAPQPLESTRSPVPAQLGGGGEAMPQEQESTELESIMQGDLSKTLDKANSMAKSTVEGM
jgi:hypothetical protein